MDNIMSNQPVNVFDEEEIEVTKGGGLDVPAGTYAGVLWGIVSYKDKGYAEKADQIINKKLVVLQLPTVLDKETQLPTVVWAYSSDAFGGKSKLHGYLTAIFGRPIGTQDPIRTESGNIDPKKLFGQNCLIQIGNVSKKEGEEKIGVMSFTQLVDGMPIQQINQSVAMPDYINDLKTGKHLQNQVAGALPVAPVLPQTVPVQQAAPSGGQVIQPMAQPPQQPVQPTIPLATPVQQPLTVAQPVQQPLTPVQPVQAQQIQPVQPVQQPLAPVQQPPEQPPVNDQTNLSMFNAQNITQP